MNLKEISMRSAVGELDTHLCLVDELQILDQPSSIYFDFGSVHNSGLMNLIQLTNAAHSLILGQINKHLQIDIAGSRMYGCVYLIDQLIDRFSLRAGLKNVELNSDEQYARTFLPTLLTALLDNYTNPTTSTQILTRRYFCPSGASFNRNDIWCLLSLITDLIEPLLEYIKVQHIPIDSILMEKLSAWAGCEWGDRLTEEEDYSLYAIMRLAHNLKEWLASQLGSPWDWIHEHLNDLHAVQIEYRGRQVFQTTRLTAAQMGIFYRLNIPFPPRLICHPQPEQVQVIINAEKVQFDDEAPDIGIGMWQPEYNPVYNSSLLNQ